MENGFKENIDSIFARIDAAAKAAGRSGADVSLMAVTKTVPAERVNQAIACGVRVLGENRVQEFLDKYDDYHLDNVSVHFIGHLQTNKVKYIADKVDMIESVDSVKLAREIDKQCQKLGRKMDVLLEVNVAAEESKFGFSLQNVEAALREIADLPALRVRGLMSIPPILGQNGGNTQYFALIQQLFVDIGAKKIDNVFMDVLSLGMSDDFEAAIACGSTQVRLGSILFGQRNYR